MKLDEYLKEFGIKQEPFAKHLGIDRKTLLKIRKTNNCSTEIMFKIKKLTYGHVSEKDWDFS